MKHAREDYNRIQDPAGLIPEDEPVFLIRGQDFVAPEAVEAWADLAESAGAEPGMVQSARDQAHEMRLWGKTYGDKLPDMP